MQDFRKWHCPVADSAVNDSGKSTSQSWSLRLAWKPGRPLVLEIQVQVETLKLCNIVIIMGYIVLDPWFARPGMVLIVMMVWAVSEARRISTCNGLLS